MHNYCLSYCGDDDCTCSAKSFKEDLLNSIVDDTISFKNGSDMKLTTRECENIGAVGLTKPDNQGLRYSKGKLRYDLFPPEAFEEIVRVYTRGAEKYEERNWERGMKWSECLRALKSHLTKWEKGETFDDELIDCHNMAMVAWNAIALLTYQLRNIGIRDVPGQSKGISDQEYLEIKGTLDQECPERYSRTK